MVCFTALQADRAKIHESSAASGLRVYIQAVISLTKNLVSGAACLASSVLLCSCLTDAKADRENPDTPGTYRGKVENTYDAAGNRILSVSFNELNVMTDRTESTFDANGNVTKNTYQSFSPEYNEITDYTYTAEGKLSERTRSDGYRYTFTYNVSGYLWQESKFLDGALTQRFDYDYEEHGNLIERREYGGFSFAPQGVMLGRATFEYAGGNGALSLEKRYGADGSWSSSKIYVTHPDGKLDSIKYSYPHGHGDFEVYTHLSNGGRVVDYYRETGTRLSSTEMNDKGGVVRYEYYDSEGVLDEAYVYVHTYDAQGRLTRTMTYRVT